MSQWGDFSTVIVEAQRKEREAIVRWLLARAERFRGAVVTTEPSYDLIELADDIERGEHLKPAEEGPARE